MDRSPSSRPAARCSPRSVPSDAPSPGRATGAVRLIFLFACSSQKRATVDDRGQEVVEEQRELIQKNVQNSDKQVQLLQILDEIEQESQDFFKYYGEYNRKIVRLNQNYNSSRQEFDQGIGDFNQQYERYLRMLIKKRFEMRKLTTRDEWAQIMDRKSSFIPQ